MSYHTEPLIKTEYSIQGNDIDEIFDNREDANNFFDNLTQEEKNTVQYFCKEWEFDEDSNRWMEGFVEIIYDSKWYKV
jgi:hypothetical protein